ncbi:MAG: hypothetical protein IJQ26_07265, partial [Lachnospiraceae bacterium]|nr:hypothetical protein [Lachnospiraceae bacterium]
MNLYLAAIPGALKVIGIILLCVILFVLLVLCLILFVPIRFYLDGAIPDTDIGKDFADRVKTTAEAKAGFHWLLHAVRGQIAYPGDLSFTVKALWFTLMGGDAEAEEAEAETAEEKTTEAEAAGEPAEKENPVKTREAAEIPAAEAAEA